MRSNSYDRLRGTAVIQPGKGASHQNWVFPHVVAGTFPPVHVDDDLHAGASGTSISSARQAAYDSD